MKTVKQYIKNPKFGTGDEPEFIPVGNTGIDAVKNRLLQVERQELNLTIKNSKNYSTLTEAIADVADDKYKFRGFVLTFNNGSEWMSKRYNGADASGFATEDNWVDTGGTKDNKYYKLPESITTITSSSSSEDISSIIGGDKGFNNIINAIKEGKILYVSSSSDTYAYLIFTYVTYEESNNAIGFKYSVPGGSINLMIKKTDSTYSAEILQEASNVSEHTLDLSPLFDEGGSPVATVTDEFLAEVKKAFDGKYSNGYMLGGYTPITLQKQSEKYYIKLVFPMPTSQFEWIIAAYTFTINETDKSVSSSANSARFVQSGTGTKALTDNGQYAEFASPVKVAGGESGAVTQELFPNTYYEFGECTSLTITLASEVSGIYNEYMFEFVSGSTPTTLTDIPNVKWQNGDKLVPEANCTYQVSIVNNCAIYAKFTNA